MTPKQFCYWLQGYFELGPEKTGLGREQVEIIKEHLAKVFNRENGLSYTVTSFPTQEGGGLDQTPYCVMRTDVPVVYFPEPWASC